MKKILILLGLCLLLINLPVVFSEGEQNLSSQEEEITLIGQLNRLNFDAAECGLVFVGALSEYTDLTVVQGAYTKDKIYVIHPGIEFKRTGTWGKLDKFVIGDFHKIIVTKKNIYKIEAVDYGEIDPGEYPVYYCKWVEKKD